jgi:hypothetical protein
MNDKSNNKQADKTQTGTLTAKYDVNGDYSASNKDKSSATDSTATNSTAAKNKASKTEYGTLTAKFDANGEYSE